MIASLQAQRSFDLYDAASVQKCLEQYIEKAVVDSQGRHLGFVTDIMISSWNNQPEFLVLDAKIKPWHLRHARFYYPLNQVNGVDTVKVQINDERAEVYENASFDPQVTELRENFPLLSLKALAESEHTGKLSFTHRPLSAVSDFWMDPIW